MKYAYVCALLLCPEMVILIFVSQFLKRFLFKHIWFTVLWLSLCYLFRILSFLFHSFAKDSFFPKNLRQRIRSNCQNETDELLFHCIWQLLVYQKENVNRNEIKIIQINLFLRVENCFFGSIFCNTLPN